MGTHWLGEDFLSPLPERQRPPVPCRPDFHVGIPFGGILYRDLPNRELPNAEDYEPRTPMGRSGLHGFATR